MAAARARISRDTAFLLISTLNTVQIALVCCLYTVAFVVRVADEHAGEQLLAIAVILTPGTILSAAATRLAAAYRSAARR